MFMNKKAVDLTINTVVVAILAVLVLVVLFYVFTGKVGSFSKQVNACPSGLCVSETECKSYGGQILPGKYLDPNGKICDSGTPEICCFVTSGMI